MIMQFTGVIESIKVVGKTINGNSIRLVTFEDGYAFRTAPDSMSSTIIENPEYQGVPVTVTLFRNRIRSVEVGEIPVTGCVAGDDPCPKACQCGCRMGEYECACGDGA